jgi:DNA-binding transcriptional LysR family regulator
VDLDGVRTFVTVVDAGRFRDAAADLSITQQAVSKRVAALERDLGVRLFTRAAPGARLTDDGRAFLPHARDLLRAERRALAAVRPGRGPSLLRRRGDPHPALRALRRHLRAPAPAVPAPTWTPPWAPPARRGQGVGLRAASRSSARRVVSAETGAVRMAATTSTR